MTSTSTTSSTLHSSVAGRDTQESNILYSASVSQEPTRTQQIRPSLLTRGTSYHIPACLIRTSADPPHIGPDQLPPTSPKANPLPPFSENSTSDRELEDLVFQRPPEISPIWHQYELSRPDLAQPRGPIVGRQPIYAARQRSLLDIVTQPGQLHEDLSFFLYEQPLAGSQARFIEKRQFVTGEIKVPTKDNFEVPVRWWERTNSQSYNKDGESSFSSSSINSQLDTELDKEDINPSAGFESALPDTHPKNVVFYIHGGGLAVGEADSEELSCRRILLSTDSSVLSHIRVYSVGYRLMPLHPASTCLSDTLAAFRHVRSLHPSSRIFLVGSSSGGQLAAFVSQLSPALSISGVVLRCPVTSDAFSGLAFVPSSLRQYHTSASNAFVTLLSGMMRRNEPRDGLGRMPLEALTHELENLPPHFIQLTSNDTLYSDGICYAKLLKSAGVDVKVQVEIGWPHTYWLIGPELQASLEAEWKMLRGLEWVARGTNHASSCTTASASNTTLRG